ncbi:MAG: Mut7-C ubiquitin/RNAse domain-containing protein [Gammaproteobacteria bacterium]|nr:Mut7-C ubiquitin/RNAse domain-containing protein [Gammaproteobacteria bacterium]MDH3375177.1 Mut7-C ubiquitin/RNAse domain-containing protein [Gammaproteobacteria bacterium]MDH3410446.1 Mut7-C ubiquitin/RNAse domain-containing protein [Gammaproteobacteria bacterium]MDH3551001.1 Mut7-C ubiquitin/RNAse domain-containing protein [Gammaproteobacteria bacterium]
MRNSAQIDRQGLVGCRRHATFRFYEELNDFLPPDRRKVSFEFAFNGTPSVKDSIEAIGVPHPEVDLVLVDDVSVGFDHLLTGGERVAVYPVFERLDIAPLTRLRPEPLRDPRFVLDVHLGKLARYLRLLGFDTLYERSYADASIAAISVAQRRLILTRDKGLLKRKEVTHGYWLRNTQPRLQIAEVIEVFDLYRSVNVFSRCMVCNHALEIVDEVHVQDALPAGLRGQFEQVSRCPGCDRLYWPGSHYDKLVDLVRNLIPA